MTTNNEYLGQIATGVGRGDTSGTRVLNNEYLRRIAEGIGDIGGSVESLSRTLTITCTTPDGTTVTGQTVTVTTNGTVVATEEYDGQPVTISVPVGMTYEVSVTNGYDTYTTPKPVSGTVGATNPSVVMAYTIPDIASITSAADIKAALDDEENLTLLVGEQITCTRGEQTLTWDVLDYDAADNEVTLAMSDCSLYPENQIFEPPQALAWFEDGLSAGAYYFRRSNSGASYTSCYFVLTTDIPAGGQLVADSSGFRTYASQSATTELETGTVSTTEVSGATYLGSAGSSTQPYLNDSARVSAGSSNFGESAILWLLNTDADAGTLRVPVTKFSRAYSYGVDGLLKGLDQEFLSCVAETDWKCACSMYECPEELGGVANSYRDPYTVRARFALLSYSEVRGTSGSDVINEGAMLDAFVGARDSDLMRYRGNASQNWFLRSATSMGSSAVRFMVPTNQYVGYSKSAKTACAIVPCCKIRGGDS